MNIKDIVDTYLTSKGLKRIGGNEGDALPLLPFLMMDMAFSLWRTYVVPLDFKHEMKRMKNDWKREYRAFNNDLFSCLNQEQKDFVIDLMDEFEEYIEHDVTVAFWQLTNVLTDEPLDRQKTLSAFLLINVLCQCARVIWTRVYDSNRRFPNKNLPLMRCEKIVDDLKNAYYGKNKRTVNCNNNTEISRAIDVLCKKQVRFLRKYLID